MTRPPLSSCKSMAGAGGGGVGKLPSWCGLGTALQEGDTELRPQPEWQLPGSHTILRAEKGRAGPGVQGAGFIRRQKEPWKGPKQGCGRGCTSVRIPLATVGGGGGEGSLGLGEALGAGVPACVGSAYPCCTRGTGKGF